MIGLRSTDVISSWSLTSWATRISVSMTGAGSRPACSRAAPAREPASRAAALADDSGASRDASSLTRSAVELPSPMATSGPSRSSTVLRMRRSRPGRHHRLHETYVGIVAERVAHHRDGLDDVGVVGQVEGDAGPHRAPEVAVLGLHRHGVPDGLGERRRRPRPGRSGVSGDDDAVGAQHGDDVVGVEALVRPARAAAVMIGMGAGPVDVADLGDRGRGLVGEPRAVQVHAPEHARRRLREGERRHGRARPQRSVAAAHQHRTIGLVAPAAAASIAATGAATARPAAAHGRPSRRRRRRRRARRARPRA